MKMLWIIYPFCSLFMIVGAGIALVSLRGIWKANVIEHWPTVDATIQSCDLKSDDESCEVVVDYTYNVLGREYKNSAIHPGYSGSSFEGHKPLYKRLKEASVVRARYNESDPNEAYLLAGNFSAHYSVFFGGMIFFSAGLFFLLTLHFAIAGNSNYAAGLDVIR